MKRFKTIQNVKSKKNLPQYSSLSTSAIDRNPGRLELLTSPKSKLFDMK